VEARFAGRLKSCQRTHCAGWRYVGNERARRNIASNFPGARVAMTRHGSVRKPSSHTMRRDFVHYLEQCPFTRRGFAVGSVKHGSPAVSQQATR
jgi:hypothetical protein